MTHGTEIPTLEDIEDSKKAMDDIQSFTYSGADSFVDANGVTRDTVNGRLKKMGYQVAIPYTGGIVFSVSDNTKTVEENNLIYAPFSAALPFTTDGNFTNDINKFFNIQLDFSTDDGASRVGTASGSTVQDELDSLTDGQTGGIITFITKVLLDAFTPSGSVEEKTSYKVTNDATSSNNGYYHWNGFDFIKDADLVVNVADVNNTSDAVSGKAVSDKFNDFKVGFLHTFTDNLIIDSVAGTIEAPSSLFLVVNGSFTTVSSFIQKPFIDGGAPQPTAVHFLLWTGSTLEVVLFTEIGAFDRDDTVIIGTIGATPSVNCDVIFNGELLRSNAPTPYLTDLPEFTQASILHADVADILTINLPAETFTIGAGFVTTQQGFEQNPAQVDIPFISSADGLHYVMYDTVENEVKVIGFAAAAEFIDSIKLGSFFLTGSTIITSEFNLPVAFIGSKETLGKIKIVPFDGYVSIDTAARTIEVTAKIFLATDGLPFVQIETTAPKAWDSTQSDSSVHYIMYNVAAKEFDVVGFTEVNAHRESLFIGVLNKPNVTGRWTVNIDGTILVDGIEAGNALVENRFSTKQAFFFGDSITFGFPDGTYIDKVVEIVEPGGFTNFGSDGATTGRLVAIMTPAPDRQGSDTFSLPDYSLADFCTIMIGTNAGVNGTVADINSFPETCYDVPYSTFTTIELHLERYPDSYYGNLALILDYITFANKDMEVFLIDAPVEIGFPTQHLEIRSALDEIHAEFAVKRILACNEAGITLRSGINSGFLNVDGTHLTVAGTDKWGTHLGYEIKKYR